MFCSLDELTTALEDWIKIWNASARPFKWTKTADQIIDRICRYCSRISGPGHSLPGQDGRIAAAAADGYGLAGGGGASQTGWRRRGRGQGGAVEVFGIKPSPPSAARVVASSV